MKSLLVIVKSDISDAKSQILGNFARNIETTISKSKIEEIRLNAGVYIIPWSSGAHVLNILLSAASDYKVELQILVLDDPEWMVS